MKFYNIKSCSVLFFLISLFVSPLSAQTHFGLRAGNYTDIDELFIGGELITPLSHSIYFNPNVEFVFVENANYLTFNFDMHYDFPTRSKIFLWTGAGLGVNYFNPEGPAESSTDTGFNLLFGMGFNARNFIPYIQGKLIFADRDDFVIGFGIRF
ncbi:MAG: hypothetical protein H6627_05045 [Calditrichae bacterium]|nr:hypothetical protein [Calditrichota bacterium]MCB9057910.1 hypothetical protein [Calditrichia bacterium]